MKTTKQFTSQELAAKRAGAVINLIISCGGAIFIICAIKFFVEKNHLFGF